MESAARDAFWQRFVTRQGAYPRSAEGVGRACEVAGLQLPAAFIALTTYGTVARVEAPGLIVGAVIDWLSHALERHEAMGALAEAHENPLLASMVPFGDTHHGLEVALDLRSDPVAVVWLDPTRYDAGTDAIVGIAASSIESYVADCVDGRGALART